MTNKQRLGCAVVLVVACAMSCFLLWPVNNEKQTTRLFSELLAYRSESSDKKSVTTERAHAIYNAVCYYAITNGTYPHGDSKEIGQALTSGTSSNPPILLACALNDSWENRYDLSIENERALLVRSAGPDGVMSNTDDKVYEFSLPVNPSNKPGANRDIHSTLNK